jgi:hypothetical protein
MVVSSIRSFVRCLLFVWRWWCRIFSVCAQRHYTANQNVCRLRSSASLNTQKFRTPFGPAYMRMSHTHTHTHTHTHRGRINWAWAREQKKHTEIFGYRSCLHQLAIRIHLPAVLPWDISVCAFYKKKIQFICTSWRRVWGNGGIAPLILNLDTRWRWVVTVTCLAH